MVHRYGDIRFRYSDKFIIKIEHVESFFELENCIQSKIINNRYSSNIDILSKTYSVNDYEKQEDVGYFYALEVEDLLNQINECN